MGDIIEQNMIKHLQDRLQELAPAAPRLAVDKAAAYIRIVIRHEIARASEPAPIKPKITRTYWLAWYRKRCGALLAACVDEAEANSRQSDPAVAYVAITGPHTIEFTEGEGLA